MLVESVAVKLKLNGNSSEATEYVNPYFDKTQLKEPVHAGSKLVHIRPGQAIDVEIKLPKKITEKFDLAVIINREPLSGPREMQKGAQIWYLPRNAKLTQIRVSDFTVWDHVKKTLKAEALKMPAPDQNETTMEDTTWANSFNANAGCITVHVVCGGLRRVLKSTTAGRTEPQSTQIDRDRPCIIHRKWFGKKDDSPIRSFEFRNTSPELFKRYYGKDMTSLRSTAPPPDPHDEGMLTHVRRCEQHVQKPGPGEDEECGDVLPRATEPEQQLAPEPQPESQPEIPIPQPQTPAPQPQTPVSQPQTPVSQSEPPVSRPEAPASQPKAPVPHSEILNPHNGRQNGPRTATEAIVIDDDEDALSDSAETDDGDDVLQSELEDNRLDMIHAEATQKRARSKKRYRQLQREIQCSKRVKTMAKEAKKKTTVKREEKNEE